MAVVDCGQILTVLQVIAAVSASHTVSSFGVKHGSSWSGDHSLILMYKSRSS